jgi:hypothetical protein
MWKWMYVVIAIVVVVAVASVIPGVRYLAPEWPHGANGVPNGDGNGVPNGGQSDGGDIVDATSLSFSMQLTNGDVGDFARQAKDIGTDEFKLRIEGLLFGFDIGYIIYHQRRASARAWELRDDEWIETPPEAWDDVWDGFVAELGVIMGELGWTQGDRSYLTPWKAIGSRSTI